MQGKVNRVRCAPWENEEFGVVSLKDLLGYAADVFCALSDVIGRIVGVPLITIPRIVQNPDYMKEISHRLAAVKRQCDEHGWQETVSRITEVENYLGGRIVPAVFQSKMADLQSHVYRLLQGQLFFHVDKAISMEYFDWLASTKSFRSAFPHSYFELCSAGECYIFGKPAASVFHSMRALELALQALARELDVPFEREQWETLINKIEAAIKKVNGPHAGADWKKKQELYSEAALHFRYLKNAWRNHVMHVRYTYDNKAAKVIWQHAGDFIDDLTQRVGLKELKLKA